MEAAFNEPDVLIIVFASVAPCGTKTPTVHAAMATELWDDNQMKAAKFPSLVEEWEGCRNDYVLLF